MNPETDDLQETFANVCVLYELALASGTSLDLQENCRHFLDALSSRRGFSYSAVWLRTAALPGGSPSDADSLQLVYAAPHVHVREERIDSDHPIVTEVHARGPYSIGSEDPRFALFVTEEDVAGGVYAVFPLASFGFLKAYARGRTDPFTAEDLAQLETVIRKFAESLEGSLAHERLLAEVAERRRVEEEREAIRRRLQHGQKMEAVGRLAGGIAHDFNNLLVGVLGTVELLQLEEGLSADLQADLDVISSAGQRGAELTRQLLAFARTNEEESSQVDLDSVVAEVVELLKRTLDASIEINVEAGLKGLRVNGVASKLHTMLINLAVNARDAMPEGGVLTISTAETSPPTPGRRAVEPTRWCKLTVRDSGVGMPEHVAERAFEPFFSTKAVGKGTGLGLATVYGIVRSHNGIVRIDSAPGRGTAFEISFPLVDAAAAEAPPVVGRGGPEQRDGMVLVVDDRADTRTTGRRMLQRLGYRVVEAADGEEALNRLTTHAAEVVAVLLDVQMPNMNGVETLDRIRRTRPELPVVMVSGYAQPDQIEALRALGVEEILPKPYSLSQLTEAIDQAAEERRTLVTARGSASGG